MRCNNYLLLYTLFSSFSILLVSSAPSEKLTRDLKQATKPDDVKLKQFLQAEPNPQTRSRDSDEPQWYPTIDLSHDVDSDYPLEKAAKAEAEQKAKTSQKTNVETRENTKAQSGNSNFKVFCEDGSKSGDCSEKAEGGEQNLSGLVVKIQEIVGKKDSIDKNEVEHLRRLVGVLAQKVHELQQRCADNSDNDGESTRDGSKSNSGKIKGYRTRVQTPIAEIEETHIVERKILKAKDRQDNKQTMSETQTIVETAGKSNSNAKVHTEDNSASATKHLAGSSPTSSHLPPASPSHIMPPAGPAVPPSPSSQSSPLSPSSQSSPSSPSSQSSPSSPSSQSSPSFPSSQSSPSSPSSQSSPSSPSSQSSPSFPSSQNSPLSPSSSNVRDSLSPSSLSKVRSLEQESRVNSAKTIEQTKSSQTSTGLGEINYLDGYPADVNFNGGFNRHMDVLKQQWPEGHWPGDGGNNVDDSSEVEEGYYYYDDEENENGEKRVKPDADFKVINMQDYIRKEQRLPPS